MSEFMTLAISEDDYAEVFLVAFRKRVGRHGISTQNLAALIGEDHRIVRAWQAGQMKPKPHQLLSLSAILGAAFLNEILWLVRLGGVHPLNGHACFFEYGKQSANWLAELNDAALDGHIDHRERRSLIDGLAEVRVTSGMVIHQLTEPLRVVAAE